MKIRLKRTETAGKRPNPEGLSNGELTLNYSSSEPGVFFKDTEGEVVKVGPNYVGPNPPNESTLESGGHEGNSKGELWLESGSKTLMVFDGVGWVPCYGDGVPCLIVSLEKPLRNLSMGPLKSGDLWYEPNSHSVFIFLMDPPPPTLDEDSQEFQADPESSGGIWIQVNESRKGPSDSKSLGVNIPTTEEPELTSLWDKGLMVLDTEGCLEMSLTGEEEDPWHTGNVTISNGGNIWLRWTPSLGCGLSSHGTSIQGGVRGSGLSDFGDATVDRVPDPFLIPVVGSSLKNTTITSPVITLNGINFSTFLWYESKTSSLLEVSINGQDWVTIPGTFGSALPVKFRKAGTTVQFRHLTPNSFGSTSNSVIRIGSDNLTNYTSATFTTVNSGDESDPEDPGSVTTPFIATPVKSSTIPRPSTSLAVTSSPYLASTSAGPHFSSDWEGWRNSYPLESTNNVTSVSKEGGYSNRFNTGQIVQRYLLTGAKLGVWGQSFTPPIPGATLLPKKPSSAEGRNLYNTTYYIIGLRGDGDIPVNYNGEILYNRMRDETKGSDHPRIPGTLGLPAKSDTPVLENLSKWLIGGNNDLATFDEYPTPVFTSPFSGFYESCKIAEFGDKLCILKRTIYYSNRENSNSFSSTVDFGMYVLESREEVLSSWGFTTGHRYNFRGKVSRVNNVSVALQYFDMYGSQSTNSRSLEYGSNGFKELAVTTRTVQLGQSQQEAKASEKISLDMEHYVFYGDPDTGRAFFMGPPGIFYTLNNFATIQRASFPSNLRNLLGVNSRSNQASMRSMEIFVNEPEFIPGVGWFAIVDTGVGREHTRTLMKSSDGLSWLALGDPLLELRGLSSLPGRFLSGMFKGPDGKLYIYEDGVFTGGVGAGSIGVPSNHMASSSDGENWDLVVTNFDSVKSNYSFRLANLDRVKTSGRGKGFVVMDHDGTIYYASGFEVGFSDVLNYRTGGFTKLSISGAQSDGFEKNWLITSLSEPGVKGRIRDISNSEITIDGVLGDWDLSVGGKIESDLSESVKIVDITGGTSNLTSVSVPRSLLPSGKKIYNRVKHNSASAHSLWSGWSSASVS